VKGLIVAVSLCVGMSTAWAQDDEVVGPPDAGSKAARPALDVSKMPFTPASIQAVVGHHQPQIQECYEEILANKSKVVEGRLNTSWTITAEGLVTNAKIVKKGSTLKNSQLDDCVIAVLSAMTFPKPLTGRPQPVDYPFNLKAIR
jgi:hypothetical protein